MQDHLSEEDTQEYRQVLSEAVQATQFVHQMEAQLDQARAEAIKKQGVHEYLLGKLAKVYGFDPVRDKVTGKGEIRREAVNASEE